MATLLVLIISTLIFSQIVDSSSNGGSGSNRLKGFENPIDIWKSGFARMHQTNERVPRTEFCEILRRMGEIEGREIFKNAVYLTTHNALVEPMITQAIEMEKDFRAQDISIARKRDAGIIPNLLSTFSPNSHGCYGYSFARLKKLADYFKSPVINEMVQINYKTHAKRCWNRLADTLLKAYELLSLEDRKLLEKFDESAKLFSPDQMYLHFPGFAVDHIMTIQYYRGLDPHTISIEQILKTFENQLVNPCTDLSELTSGFNQELIQLKSIMGNPYEVSNDPRFVRLLGIIEVCNQITNNDFADQLISSFQLKLQESTLPMTTQ